MNDKIKPELIMAFYEDDTFYFNNETPISKIVYLLEYAKRIALDHAVKIHNSDKEI